MSSLSPRLPPTRSNNTSGGGRTLYYTTFDKPYQINKGGHTTEFAYGPDRSRYRRVDTGSGVRTTRYIGNVEIIFQPNGDQDRKRYIAGALQPTGRLRLDDGAVRALKRGKSLLPAGVTSVEGKFERGDSVTLLTPSGEEIARGLAAYSAADASRIIGFRSGEIEARLGYRGREELIHRDDLVLM